MLKIFRFLHLFAWACAVVCGRRVHIIEDQRRSLAELSLGDADNSSSSDPTRALASYLFAKNPSVLPQAVTRPARHERSLHRKRARHIRMRVTEEDGYNDDSTEIKLADWETRPMPVYDYRREYYKRLLKGMSKCREENKNIVPLLQQLRQVDFFAYFAVDLMGSCRYMPTEEVPCELDKCEVEPTEDVPENIVIRDNNEYDFSMDAWSRKDMPSDFTEYFDMREQPEKDTGYNGTRVWRFIHQKICFQRDIEVQDNGWKRDFNRAVSGMHAAVSTNILSDIGFNEEGRMQYRRRLRDEPGAIANLYFVYMLTLNAIHEMRARLDKCNYLGDGEAVRPIMQAITASDLLNSEAVIDAARNLRNHANESRGLVWKARLRSRNIHEIMDCVQCNSCRIHGKVLALGLGATFQVLLGSDGQGGDPRDLDRAQVAALVVAAAKFGAACDVVEKFREFDGEDMSNNFNSDI